jgi:hypothetical protein
MARLLLAAPAAPLRHLPGARHPPDLVRFLAP